MGDELRRDYVDSRRRALGLANVRERQVQSEQILSVSSRIAASILGYFVTHDGLEFHADDLRRHVAAQCGLLAPGSADRVMRDMRARGVISYRLINRAQSLYRAGQSRENAQC